jgi:two-component system, OmpR family, phosphate regulon sensor histidine kinase PhoR
MRLSQPRHIYAQLKQLLILILVFVLVPSACLLSLGILVLVFSNARHNIVFGVLILSLVATLTFGITAIVNRIFRGAELAKLQTDFVAKVSHDLRTPLTSIRMFIETLQLGRADDAAKKSQCLDIMLAETDRLAAMIERLLHWGRMEAGRRLYGLHEHEVRTIVEQTLAAFSAQLLHTPAQVECTIPPDLPRVSVDQDAIMEALLNLLQNAHRYTGPEKRIEVRCGVRRKEVFISIIDNGPGIPQSERRNIFKKFYRGQDSIERNLVGSGLGLAIVEHIVRAHHGYLTLESAEGTGAAFTVFLPALTHEEHRSGETAHHRG